MILNIENLGSIKQVQIDLSKRYNLLCGKNSTGKTYASYILNAFLSFEKIPDLQAYKSIRKHILEKGVVQLKNDYLIEWLNDRCSFVKKNLSDIFGISDSTCEKLFQNFQISAELLDADQKRILKEEFNIEFPGYKIIKAVGTDYVSFEISTEMTDFEKNSHSMDFDIMLWLLLRLFILGRGGKSRMLTVERNSIYTFKTELSLSRNELVDRIQQLQTKENRIIDVLNNSSRRYPLAVRNSLRVANDLENVQKQDSPYRDIADRIERDLLKGEVSMTKNGDVEFHAANMAKSKRLPFHMSSSIVKTMASLVIYLRHIAIIGDTLIIDEPEMNFHPDVQVLLAQIFAILTSRGIYVVISTHSDYIVREMNNLIMAEALKKKGNTELLNELALTEDMLLDYHDVAVLQFKQASKSTVKVSSLPIDENGFAIDTIDETIERQNHHAELLYDALNP